MHHDDHTMQQGTAQWWWWWRVCGGGRWDHTCINASSVLRQCSVSASSVPRQTEPNQWPARARFAVMRTRGHEDDEAVCHRWSRGRGELCRKRDGGPKIRIFRAHARSNSRPGGRYIRLLGYTIPPVSRFVPSGGVTPAYVPCK
eukprot:gene8271-biopygen12125